MSRPIQHKLSKVALRNQLGLGDNVWLRLELMIADGIIDINRHTVNVLFTADGQVNIFPHDKGEPDEKALLMVMVFAHITTNPLDYAYSLACPWEYLTRDAPDKGHGIYQCSDTDGFIAREVSNENDTPYLPVGARSMYEKSNIGELNLFIDFTGGQIAGYGGKTSQGLYKRFRQHNYSSLSGKSTTPLHTAMRGTEKFIGIAKRFILLELFPTSDAAFDAEERLIRELNEDASIYCLNVLSSRDAYARLLDLFPNLKRTPPERAEEELYQRRVMPRPRFISDEEMAAIVCGTDNRLTQEQVRLIRTLGANGIEVERIAEVMTEVEQPSEYRQMLMKHRVKSVLENKTYAFVK